ncbi:flagellar motor switch protein FliM [Agilicoccus flavus]|uniref:flagellar motor switch protein FliM n=1 Tax=Agilicoccus flavus TaxID=2775968 RepID=UPI001CF63699|nr:flagellar motor switch protein FliM [Agilicoccus flavus]
MNPEPLPYDFRSPSRFSREQVRALQMVNETFARQMATVLSTTLRTVAHATLEDVEQSTYDDYTRRLPVPSVLAILNFPPLTGAGIFHLPLPIVMNVIDRLLGGPGHENQPERELSEIESGLIRNLVQRIVHELAYAFDTLASIQPQVTALEADATFLQLAPPSDPMIVSDFELKIGDQVVNSSLCIPVATLQPVLDAIDAKPELELTGAQALAAEHIQERMSDVPVRVTVAFEPISLASKDILQLEVGDVVPLRHPTNQPLTMTADGVPVAKAVPGSHGKRLACQIVNV